MAVLSTIGDIVRDLLIFVAVMTALLITLIVVVSKMPADNPLKRVLTALCYRLGATAAVDAVREYDWHHRTAILAASRGTTGETA